MKQSEVLLKEIGENLRAWRERSGLKTKYQGAKVLGVSWETMTRIEDTCKNVPTDLLVRSILNEYIIKDSEQEWLLNTIEEVKQLRKEEK